MEGIGRGKYGVNIHLSLCICMKLSKNKAELKEKVNSFICVLCLQSDGTKLSNFK